MAAQDLVLQSKYHATTNYKQRQRANVDCKQFDETVEQIISACTVLAKGQYIQRHDTVCAELHCNMCEEIGGNCTASSCMAVY
jgi:hypothetical protein